VSKGAVAKVRFIGDAKDLLKTTKRIDSNVRGLSAGFKKLGGFAKIALGGFAITKVVGFLKQSVRAADDAAKAQKRLDAVFTASGLKGSKLFKDLNQQAKSIAIKLGIDDAEVAAVQLKLSAYLEAFAFQGAEGAKKFEEVTKLAFDIDAAGLADAETAAKTLGRVLLEPLDAASRLKKLGIQLTNDQIDSIKELVAQGKIAEAQSIILDAISKQVGGTAEANTTALDRLNTAISRIVGAIGILFLPLLEPLAKGLEFVALKVEEWTGANSEFANQFNTVVLPAISNGIQKLKDWFTESGLAKGATELFDRVLEALGFKVEGTDTKLQGLTKTTEGYRLENEKATAAILEAKKKKDNLKASVDSLFEGLKSLLKALGDLTVALGKPLLGVLAFLVEKSFPPLINSLKEVTKGFEVFAIQIGYVGTQLGNFISLVAAIATGSPKKIKDALAEIEKDAKEHVRKLGLLANEARAIAASMTGSNTIPSFNMPFGGNPVVTPPKVPTPKITTPDIGGSNKGGSSGNTGKTIIKEIPKGNLVAGSPSGNPFDVASVRAGEERSMELLAAMTAQTKAVGEVVDELAQIRAKRQYEITVNQLVPNAQTGKAVVEAIKQFEQRSGNADRFSALAL